MHDTRTRSPGATVRTLLPTSSTVPDRLVAEHPARLGGGDVALEDVQVGAADRDAVDADDGVVGALDGRVRDVLPGPAAGTVVDECLHASSPASGGAAGERRWARRSRTNGPRVCHRVT